MALLGDARAAPVPAQAATVSYQASSRKRRGNSDGTSEGRSAQALVRENPRDVNAALLLARIAINANCFEDAQEILERITQMAPRFIAAWHDLGTVLKELHAFDEAVEALRTALAMDQSNALTHYYHGAALAMAARPEEAVAAYEQAVSLDAELTGAHIGLGHVLKTIGDQEVGSGLSTCHRTAANFGGPITAWLTKNVSILRR